MTLIEIFEKVNLVFPIEQRDFFNYFDDSVKEIEALYGSGGKKLVFTPDTEYKPPATLKDDNAVLPLYSGAIVDNILFLSAAIRHDLLKRSEVLLSGHDRKFGVDEVFSVTSDDYICFSSQSRKILQGIFEIIKR